ncbi:MAG: flagellar biosynthetic protein FliR [Planctomycetaceae bacterium]
MIELWVVHLTLTLIRVAAFVAFLPPTTGRNLPQPVKIGVAMMLALFFGFNAPIEPHPWLTRAGEQWLAFGILGVRETCYGIGLAMCLGLMLMPARMAGAYIAQEMGLSIATLTGPTDGQQSTLVGVLLETVAGLLFFSLNLHLAVISFLAASFEHLAPGRGSLTLSPGWWLTGVTDSIEAGLLMAAPVGIVLMLTLLASLVLMRSVPQFNLFSVGMSVRLIAGLGAMLFFGPEIMVLLRQSLFRVWSLVGV